MAWFYLAGVPSFYEFNYNGDRWYNSTMMKDKTYSIEINASKQHVWETMLGKETYPRWSKGFSDNPQAIGDWKTDSEIDFVEEGRGGTRAVLEVVDEPNRVLARHIAMLDKDRMPETEGMENWVGTTEEYRLTEKNGVTNMTVLMHFYQDYEQMFDEGWPKCLQLLKELCEI